MEISDSGIHHYKLKKVSLSALPAPSQFQERHGCHPGKGLDGSSELVLQVQLCIVVVPSRMDSKLYALMNLRNVMTGQCPLALQIS